MRSRIYRAEDRGHVNHGWLESHHSFSFASFYNPELVHFGALRVLNDDKVIGGEGFGMHPHDNMEIVSIPLEGELRHKDNMGNESIIKEGEVQVMSAGTGIFHSEYNNSEDKDVRFLQIWILPNKKNVKPRYDQISIKSTEKENGLFQIVSPDPDDEGVWIHQNAWIHLGRFVADKSATYSLKDKDKTNGLYVFVLEGEIEVEGQTLRRRDALSLYEIKQVTFKINKEARVLLIEVPTKL